MGARNRRCTKKVVEPQHAFSGSRARGSAAAPATPGTQPVEIHLAGFLDRVKSLHEKSHDSRLLFLLGSGASRQSRIKTGGEMVTEWLEMLRREDPGHESISSGSWATAERLGIPTFDPKDPAASYPEVFARAYQGRGQEGFDFLEAEIAGKEPSYGYSVLAQILDETRHKVIVTTNFDNLVVDAVSVYTRNTPLVCGHESLAGFIRHRPSRPQIVKVHRDLFYSPKNTTQQIGPLPEPFAEVLRTLLRAHVPVVVGYGGNDGSLMGVLEGLNASDLPQGLYWCYWNGGGGVRKRIQDLVARLHGWLVPISGFDELMINLQNGLRLAPLDDFLKRRGDERAEQYKGHRDTLGRSLSPGAIVQVVGRGETFEERRDQAADSLQALQSIIAGNKAARTAGQWDSLAKLEPDLGKRGDIYQEGLRALPKSAWMHEYAALYLGEDPTTKERANTLYKAAAELAPNDPAILGNYARFLNKVFREHDAAEALHRLAIEADPSRAIQLSNYAIFLQRVRRNHNEAEALYKRAIAANPRHVNTLCSYAALLREVRSDYDAAEALYKRAVEADPGHVDTLWSYASFLWAVRKDGVAAEALYKRAIEGDPKNAESLDSYANFLAYGRKNYDAAEALYKRAAEADPKNATSLSNYGSFLADFRKDYAAAELYYKRAIEADPTDANSLGNYSGLLFSRGRSVEGLASLDRAIRLLDPAAPGAIDAECWMYGYCCKPQAERLFALSMLRRLVLEKGIRTGDWNFAGVIAQATQSQHSEAAWLPRLADVLGSRREPKELEDWRAWRSAGPA